MGADRLELMNPGGKDPDLRQERTAADDPRPGGAGDLQPVQNQFAFSASKPVTSPRMLTLNESSQPSHNQEPIALDPSTEPVLI